MQKGATILALLVMGILACGDPESPADDPEAGATSTPADATRPAVRETDSTGPSPNDPNAAIPGTADRGVTTTGYDLLNRPKVQLSVTVDMQPPPETKGGHVFLAGFNDLNPRTKMPIRGSQPQDYKTLAMFVQNWPTTTEVELITGMHYFVMYGFNDWPSPGDRMSTFIEITEETTGPLSYTIDAMSIPKDEEGPGQPSPQEPASREPKPEGVQ